MFRFVKNFISIVIVFFIADIKPISQEFRYHFKQLSTHSALAIGKMKRSALIFFWGARAFTARKASKVYVLKGFFNTKFVYFVLMCAILCLNSLKQNKSFHVKIGIQWKWTFFIPKKEIKFILYFSYQKICIHSTKSWRSALGADARALCITV